MKCGKCGHVFNDEMTFCPSCGSYVFTGKNKSNKESGPTPHIPDYYKKRVKKRDDAHIMHNKDTISEISAASATTYDSENADVEEPKKNSGFKAFIIGLFITVLLLGSAVFTGYYVYNKLMGSSTTEYTGAISELYNKVNNANSNVSNLIKKDSETLPVKDIIKQLQEEYASFNQITKDFDKIAAPSMYSDSHEKLGEAIKLNKLIFQHLDIILSNPVNPDMKNNMDLLSKYIDESMANYAEVKIKNFNFTLPNEILSISSKIQPWIKQKQAEYSHIMTLINSFSKYFDNMAKLFVTYDSAYADFKQMISAVRNGQENWDILFDEIDNSENIIKTVKEDYKKMTVPDELKAINKRFEPILDERLMYYSTLKLAAETERDFKEEDSSNTDDSSENVTNPDGSTAPPPNGSTQTEDNKQDADNEKPKVFKPNESLKKTREIESLYQEAEKYNSQSSLNYQKFAIDLKSEKDKHLDPEFVLQLKAGK